MLGFLLLTSCNKEECSDPIPQIEFSSFVVTDSTNAVLTISFKDCDGDVGLSRSDTTGPYSIDGDYYYNLFLDYYEKQNGVWVKWEDLEPPFYYRVPRITIENPKNALIGDIQIELEPLYYVPFGNYDTLKFEITLVDRALNRSNTVSTDEIYKPD